MGPEDASHDPPQTAASAEGIEKLGLDIDQSSDSASPLAVSKVPNASISSTGPIESAGGTAVVNCGECGGSGVFEESDVGEAGDMSSLGVKEAGGEEDRDSCTSSVDSGGETSISEWESVLKEPLSIVEVNGFQTVDVLSVHKASAVSGSLHCAVVGCTDQEGSERSPSLVSWSLCIVETGGADQAEVDGKECGLGLEGSSHALAHGSSIYVAKMKLRITCTSP